MSRYKKFLGMLLVTVLAGVAPMFNDGISAAEVINALILLFGSATVLGATNLPAGVWLYAKTIFAVGSAVLMVVAAAITDGAFTADELIQTVLAAAGVLGIVPLANNVGSAENGASTVATGLPTNFIEPPQAA